MSATETDAGRIAASGRTLEEHLEIASSLQTDPKGSSAITLDFESGDLAGWSIRRLAKALFGRRSRTRSCASAPRPAASRSGPGDEVSQGLRAELRDWYNAPFDVDIWYGFSTYLPKDFHPPRGVGVVLAQWHDQAELGDPVRQAAAGHPLSRWSAAFYGRVFRNCVA